MHRKDVGSLTVLRFFAECVQRGWTVSEPFGDNAPYDAIVDSGGKLLKIQVKSASPKGGLPGVFTVNTTRKVLKTAASGGPGSVSVPYKLGELDLIVTCAGGSWFFFTNPPDLPGIVEVRPDAEANGCKWNSGKNRWDLIGTAEPSESDDTPTNEQPTSSR
jgi:hypothetical protein